MDNFIMKSWRSKRLVCLLSLVIIDLLSVECRNPVLHKVGGGRYTWHLNINFTNWSIHEQFYVGDWLFFGFDKRIYNVLEVNKTGYENCNENGFVTNVTRGGRDVFNLTEAKVYYFLSGRGFCFKGVKVEVPVQEFPPNNSQPHDDHDLDIISDYNNGFSCYYNHYYVVVAMFAIAFTCALLLL